MDWSCKALQYLFFLHSVSTRPSPRLFYIILYNSGVLCKTEYSALTGLGPVYSDGALSPRQRKLERLEEIEDAPANNHIVVEAHETTNLRENERKQQNSSPLATTFTSTHKHTQFVQANTSSSVRALVLSTQLKSVCVYELLSCLLSAAEAGVLYEAVFIAAESLYATSRLPHASLPLARAPSPL